MALTETPSQHPMLRSGFELRQGPVTALRDFQTPLTDLYMVTHMGIADVKADNWCLQVGGLVAKPLQLRLGDLAAFPRRKMISVLECAGSPLAPTVPVRRFGNVEWEGVPLESVLAEAGVLPEARYMWSTGAERGVFNKLSHPYYQKDLPISVALSGNALLATHINGEPLLPDRGAPVRLIIPDFYGNNSTKWLTSLELCTGRSPAYFSDQLYNGRCDGAGDPRPVWALAPHAVFVSHADGAAIAAGPQTLWGWAWAAGGVAQVEVSVDGGVTWHAADLAPRFDHAWQKFSLEWEAAAGSHRLICRAMANDGNVQPAQGARNEWFRIGLEVVA